VFDTERQIAQMNPDAAYQNAITLQQLGLHTASVPYFRRVLHEHPRVALIRIEYAEALHNSSIQTDVRLGPIRYAVPSSQERMALVSEAIRELRVASTLAQNREERAYALFRLARVQSMVGLSMDALDSIEKAYRIQPRVGEIRDLRSALRSGLNGSAKGSDLRVEGLDSLAASRKSR
jgi:tetratricopeptide (TPR) repeat protein